ncbi:MAG: nitroreductase [Bacteroidia bacterium]|nr:nitroreductase [Bacteroidia bacterium]
MINTLNKIIHGRQSVYPKSFSGEIISVDLINEILDNANQAPSHKHTEPWRFHVITPKSKLAFIKFAQDAYTSYTDPDNFKGNKFDKIPKKINLSSHILMISMHRNEDSGLPEWEEVAAVATAIQNIYLTLTALSLGGYWSSPQYIITHANKFFDMHENEKCLGLFYIGVPQGELPPKPQKKPIGEKVTWY